MQPIKLIFSRTILQTRDKSWNSDLNCTPHFLISLPSSVPSTSFHQLFFTVGQSNPSQMDWFLQHNCIWDRQWTLHQFPYHSKMGMYVEDVPFFSYPFMTCWKIYHMLPPSNVLGVLFTNPNDATVLCNL